MLIGQRCSCILNRCSLLIYPHPPLAWDCLICLANMFCVFVSCGALFNFIQQPRNPFFIDCGIMRQLNPWLFNWVFGVWLGRRGDVPSSSGESLMSQNWPDLIAEICSCFEGDYKNMWRICEEYACDSVKSCSCWGADGAPLERKEKHREANSLVTCSWVSLLFPISGSLFLCHSVRNKHALHKI